MPFCSRLCANQDLLAWLSHAYVIPATEDREGEADELSGGRASPPGGETGGDDTP